jgi:RNA polymerase sigma-70 factor (ECF subfamily)
MHATLHSHPAHAEKPRTRVSESAAQEEAHTAAAHILAIAERADRAAFTVLFARYAPRIKAMLIRRGAADSRAEELAQEAMLNVWRKAASFDPARGGGEAWIFTIARNVAIDARRRERGLPQVSLEVEHAPSDPTPLGDELLAANEAADRVRAAIQALSADQIEVIRQSYFEDRSHMEIAEALKLPLGTVKSRLRLALARLRTLTEGLG